MSRDAVVIPILARLCSRHRDEEEVHLGIKKVRHVEESKMRAWHFIEIRHIAAAAGAIEVYFDDPRRESAASPLKHKRRHITGRSKSLARPTLFHCAT